ncbi:MAG: methyl-accepting chemotaxis protein [Leptospiraceae bacterium]|nr:methyl-accepting chemotaxis protein [Leptospiraceae bacterium]
MIKNRFLLILIGFTIIPLLVSAIITYNIFSKYIITLEEEKSTSSANTAINLFLRTGVIFEHGVKIQTFWDDAKYNFESRNLAWIDEQFGASVLTTLGADYVFAIDKNYLVMSSTGKEVLPNNLSTSKIFQKMQTETKIHTGLYKGLYGLSFATVSKVLLYEGKGTPGGYAIFGFYLKPEHIASAEQESNCQIFIYNEASKSIYSSNNVTELPFNPKDKKVTFKDKTYLLSSQIVKGLDESSSSTIYVLTPAKASIEAKNGIQIMIPILILASLLITYFSANSIADRIVVPILKLSEYLTEVEKGNLTREENNRYFGEIGTIFKTYNKMISGLKNLIIKILGFSENLTTSSVKLNNKSIGLNQSSSEISENILKITSSTKEISTKVKESRDKIQDMKLKLEETENSFLEMKDVSNEASEIAGKGFNKIHSSESTMNQLLSSSENLQTTIIELKKNSEHIHSILEVVASISKETNLLSLNASIEASRAGEQGKGFAVVAEEINKLAISTASSISEIKSTVDSLQTVIGSTIQKISVESKLIHSTANELSQAKQAIIEIKEIMKGFQENLNIQFKKIESVNLEGTKLLEQINSFDRFSDSVAQSAERTLEVSNGQFESSVEMKELAKDMNTLMKELKNLTEQFRIQ